jgi:hypothetical protein
MRRTSLYALALCIMLVCAAMFVMVAVDPGATALGALGSLGMVPLAAGMMGATEGLSKSAKCTAAIGTAFTIAKFGADDDTMSVASAATDGLIGIFQHTTTTAGDDVRVMLDGISPIKLGGGVTRGNPITSDAAGKGVAAVLGQNIIGFALASGVNGDIVPLKLAQGVLNSAGGANGNSFKLLATAVFDTGGVDKIVGDYALGVIIPIKAIITRGYADIITPFVSTSNDGTIALKAQGAGDLLAAVDADTLSNIVELIPDGTAAKMIKMTAARELTVSVATHKLTAGKAVFFVEYVMSL